MLGHLGRCHLFVLLGISLEEGRPDPGWKQVWQSWARVSLVFFAGLGTQWVLNKCLLWVIKSTLFTPGLSPKTTFHT